MSSGFCWSCMMLGLMSLWIHAQSRNRLNFCFISAIFCIIFWLDRNCFTKTPREETHQLTNEKYFFTRIYQNQFYFQHFLINSTISSSRNFKKKKKRLKDDRRKKWEMKSVLMLYLYIIRSYIYSFNKSMRIKTRKQYRIT